MQPWPHDLLAGNRSGVELYLGSVLDSWRNILIAALVVFAAATVAKLALTRVIKRFLSPHAIEITDAILVGLLASMLVTVLLVAGRYRRQRVRAYLAEVAELNHNVRNALAVIQYQTALSHDEAAAADRIQDAVRRIEQTISRIFPAMPKKPPASTGRHGDRMRSLK